MRHEITQNCKDEHKHCKQRIRFYVNKQTFFGDALGPLLEWMHVFAANPQDKNSRRFGKIL